jgi:two-component system, OmpR family, sensor histidine kinase MprB
MSFRARLALVATAAVGLAVVAASLVVFVVVSDQLRGQADTGLKERASGIGHVPDFPNHLEVGFDGNPCVDIPTPVLGPNAYVQVVGASGVAVHACGERALLPVNKKSLAAARGRAFTFFDDAQVSGRHYRILTVPGPGYALQVGRDVSEVDHTIHKIEIFLFLIAAGGIAVAAALGLVVARAALTPVRRLTETAEHVTATGDLSERIETTRQDELGRLAASFNTMLAALEESSRAQRQLVADASHELRTPLTSLRTNIEVLARGDKLATEDRERLLEDVVEQIGEMTALIGELIELARGERETEAPEDVRLDQVAAGAVERAQRNRPNVVFKTDLQESLIHGAPSTIERAVANLLDNAAKWSPDGGEVEVGVRDGEVSVRDHGPGIAEEDLPYVFDRFYRARGARGLPGSGLGLAIVKQVADAHGGQVVAERAEGGGTRMRLLLNGRA